MFRWVVNEWIPRWASDGHAFVEYKWSSHRNCVKSGNDLCLSYNWTAKLTQTHTQNTTSAHRSYELLKWRTLSCFMGPQKTTQKWNKSLWISYFYIIWSFSHFYRPKLLRNTIFTANIVMALMCVHAHYADINDMSVWLLCHEKWISISHQFLSNWSRTHEFIREYVSAHVWM